VGGRRHAPPRIFRYELSVEEKRRRLASRTFMIDSAPAPPPLSHTLRWTLHYTKAARALARSSYHHRTHSPRRPDAAIRCVHRAQAPTDYNTRRALPLPLAVGIGRPNEAARARGAQVVDAGADTQREQE
jgi:hypothetical protein